MSIDITTLGIVGSDGVVPIYQPNDRWCWWSLQELWMGSGPGMHKYVPKVNDYVMDHGTYTTYIVDHIDPVTLIPTLREKRPYNMSTTFSESDVLFGGSGSDTYRVYIDKTVMPYVLAVDARLKVGGSQCTYAKLYKTGVVGAQTEVVSKIYNANGMFQSENVPLELVAIDSHVNHSIKTISVCHTTHDLQDGEIIIAVLYNDNGHVVSKRSLLVEETSFIRSLDASKKYVTNISAKSPFISTTSDHVIEFPLNVPVNALNIIGVVHYSDGSTLELPVDGTKFKMYGLDQYLSSIVGQTVDLVLSYALGRDEEAYAGIQNGQEHYVTEPYTLKTINPNNSYTVKLMGYPVWVNDVSGYTMKFFLLNLDRSLAMDVTPFVRFNTNTGPFNPTGYGYIQRKSISLNLRDVSGAFKPLIHTQLMEIVLNGRPDEGYDAWTVSHEAIAGRPIYGAGLVAKRVDAKVLNLSSGCTELSDWVDKVYYRTYPVINGSMETKPIRPTHFIVEYGAYAIERSITQWDQDVTFISNPELYKNVYLKFIKRTSANDLVLGVSAMLIRP